MRYHLTLLITFLLVLLWSAIAPHDYLTWWLEVFPAVIGLVIILVTYRKFPLTDFLYTLILIHAIILCVGGHYTYAEVPLFDWIRDLLGQARNNYDKVGHLAQGFIPAFIAREVMLRKWVVTKSWVGFLSIAICMALSSLYEIFEWWVSVLTGSAGDSFLGTQGYIWDTQSDMFYAMLGAMIGILFFSRFHDRAMKHIV